MRILKAVERPRNCDQECRSANCRLNSTPTKAERTAGTRSQMSGFVERLGNIQTPTIIHYPCKTERVFRSLTFAIMPKTEKSSCTDLLSPTWLCMTSRGSCQNFAPTMFAHILTRKVDCRCLLTKSPDLFKVGDMSKPKSHDRQQIERGYAL